MKLPFTIEDFLHVFDKYNAYIWPLQLFFNLLAISAILLVLKKIRHSDKIISLILTFLWLWMGIVYHIIYFSVINRAAYIFGLVFILQGIIFFYYGVRRGSISFKINKDIDSMAGWVLIVYALIIYPVLGYFQGRIFPSNPTFGLPCPTTIFTFGILLLTQNKLPFVVLIVPLIWSVIGFTAAFQLGIKEDTGLLIAGIVTGILISIRNRKEKVKSQKS